MLGLPKKTEKPAEILDTTDRKAVEQRLKLRRRAHPERTVLVPRMVGSMMIMVPWREDGVAIDNPGPFPSVSEK